MKRTQPCGRCGIVLSIGTLYCTFCGHQPWAHKDSCHCGTCAPLLNFFNDLVDDIAARSGYYPVDADGNEEKKGGAA